MDSITKSETKSSKFNVVEYAVGNIFNRHIISTTDKPIIPSEKEELYRSHFLHTEELTQLIHQNRKPNGKSSIAGYNGELSVDKIVIDIPKYVSGRKVYFVNDYIDINTVYDFPCNLFLSNDCDFLETMAYETIFYIR